MYVVFFVGVFAVLLTYLQKKGLKNGLKYAFILLGVVAAIRCDYGNDYNNYYNTFLNITTLNMPLRDLLSLEGVEIGWRILCLLFKPFGYLVFIAAISIFQAVVYYKIINKYVNIRWQWLAVFFYALNPTIWLLQMSMIRQGLAITLFLYSILVIEKKKIIPALLLIIIAVSIHTTALILLPLVCFCFLNIQEKPRIIALFLCFSYFLCIISKDFLPSALQYFLTFDAFESYEMSYGDEVYNDSLGLGYIIKSMIYYIGIIILYKERNKVSCNRYCVISIFYFSISLIFNLLGIVIPMAGRLMYYFDIYGLLAIPCIFSVIKERIVRMFFLLMFVAFTFYEFRGFFDVGSVYRIPYIHYRTIFSIVYLY